jgi:hypothetical protein
LDEPTLGSRLLGLARQFVGLVRRTLVGFSDLSRLALDRAAMGMGRFAVGVAGRLLDAFRWLLSERASTSASAQSFCDLFGVAPDSIELLTQLQ